MKLLGVISGALLGICIGIVYWMAHSSNVFLFPVIIFLSFSALGGLINFGFTRLLSGGMAGGVLRGGMIGGVLGVIVYYFFYLTLLWGVSIFFLDKNLQAFFQILFWVALGMGIIVGGIVGSQILHSGYKKFD